MLVDDQSGSKELFPHLQALTPNVMMTRIDPPYGDVAWLGNGPDGSTLRIGVEYKKFAEFMDSLVTGRFAGHQLIGMLEHYDRRYLLIEGRLRIDRDTGYIQQQEYDWRTKGWEWTNVTSGRRIVTSADLEHWQTTIEEQTQFRVKFTFGEKESARWVYNKYTWWVEKGWDDHKALQQFHIPPPPTAGLIKKPSVIRHMARVLDHIGWDKSILVEQKFKTPRAMANANAQSWMEIPGVGKTIANSVIKQMTEEDK